ncbi:MAG: porin [Gammaproteobacteria bacterium]|nr:porin [Gammaproteobacteria bacterium]
MNMNQKTAALVVAASIFGSATAADLSVTPYGKIRLTMQNTDDAELEGKEVKSNFSHFGFRGKGKLSDSLTAFYKIEWQVDSSDKSDSDNIKARDQYIGLAGGFGEVLMGRKDTPLRVAQGRVDQFNQLEGDIDLLFKGEVRADNIFQYSTPEMFGGLKIKYANMSIDGTLDGDDILGDDDNDPATPDVVVGDRESTDANSIAVEWSSDHWFFAYAQDKDVSAEGSKTKRFSTQYKWGNWTLGAIYNNHDYPADSVNGLEAYNEEGYLVSAAYTTGDHTLKFQTGESDDLDKRDLSSVGWNIALSKQTDVHFFYTVSDDMNNNEYSWYGFGIDQSF